MLGKLKIRAGLDPRKPIGDADGAAGDGGPDGSDGARGETRAERTCRMAVWVTVGAAVLGVLAATGASPIPHGTATVARWLHPLVIALGVIAGVISIQRAREIDLDRWRIVRDTALTSGEREWAHKEAERGMRSAATTLLLAACAVGAWLAYQTRTPGVITAADLLVATPVVGFGVGLIIGSRRYPKIAPEL